MMKHVAIKLTDEERQLLLTRVQLPRLLRAAIYPERQAHGEWSFKLSDDDADEIRNLCMDAFQEIGIGPDDEPNKTGLLLEDLSTSFLLVKARP